MRTRISLNVLVALALLLALPAVASAWAPYGNILSIKTVKELKFPDAVHQQTRTWKGAKKVILPAGTVLELVTDGPKVVGPERLPAATQAVVFDGGNGFHLAFVADKWWARVRLSATALAEAPRQSQEMAQQRQDQGKDLYWTPPPGFQERIQIVETRQSQQPGVGGEQMAWEVQQRANWDRMMQQEQDQQVAGGSDQAAWEAQQQANWAQLMQQGQSGQPGQLGGQPPAKLQKRYWQAQAWYLVSGPLVDSSRAHKARNKLVYFDGQHFWSVNEFGDQIGIDLTLQAADSDLTTRTVLAGPIYRFVGPNGVDFRLGIQAGITQDNRGQNHAAWGPKASIQAVTADGREIGIWISGQFDNATGVYVGGEYELGRNQYGRLYAIAKAGVYNGQLSVGGGLVLWDKTKTFGLEVYVGLKDGVPQISAGPRLNLSGVTNVELRPTTEVVTFDPQTGQMRVHQRPVVVGEHEFPMETRPHALPGEQLEQ